MILTNYVGLIVTATVLSASDAGVTLVYGEDGVTNTLAWAKLSPSSQDSVCAETGFAPIPPELDAVYRRVSADLRRADDLVADGRLTKEAASARRNRILSAFAEACREKGVPSARQKLLLSRLQDSSS